MTTIEIDPHELVENDLVLAGFKDISGLIPLVGELVSVAVAGSPAQGNAIVARLDRDRREIFLDVDWDSLRDKNVRG